MNLDRLLAYWPERTYTGTEGRLLVYLEPGLPGAIPSWKAEICLFTAGKAMPYLISAPQKTRDLAQSALYDCYHLLPDGRGKRIAERILAGGDFAEVRIRSVQDPRPENWEVVK